MPIDDKIELHLIDTKDLVEEAKKIREARNLAKQSQDVKKELAAGVAPLGQPETNKTGAPISNKPKAFFESEQQTRKTAIGGARTQTAFTQQQAQQKLLEQKQTELEKSQRDAEKKQAELEKEIKKKQLELEREQKEFQDKLMGRLRGVQAIANPSGYAIGLKYTVLGFLGKWGIIGSAIAGALGIVIDDIQKQFDNGGVFSTYLKQPRQAQTIENIDSQNQFNSGTKYITNDLRVIQKAPQNSNTARLSSESVRYVVDNLGRTA